MTTKTKLIREGRQFLKRVFNANQDLVSRLQALSVTIAYDRDDDTFMLTPIVHANYHAKRRPGQLARPYPESIVVPLVAQIEHEMRIGENQRDRVMIQDDLRVTRPVLLPVRVIESYQASSVILDLEAPVRRVAARDV